jgi:predicted amidophosphoribosyltransferase
MKLGLLELVVILMAPLVVLLITAFVLIMMFVVRRTRPVSKIAPEPKIEFCPNCSHKLIEVRNFCAQCGASIKDSPRPRLASPETPS